MKEYPDGKISDGDDGALKMLVYVKDGRVVIDFGKDLSWLGFDKDSLKRFIDGLTEKYEQI